MRRVFSIAASLYWLLAFAPVSNNIYSHSASADNERSMVMAVALSIAFALLLALRRTA